MIKKENKEVCEKCKHKFQWSAQGDIWSGGKDRENVVCPYCGNIAGSVMTSGYISVQKIESDK